MKSRNKKIIKLCLFLIILLNITVFSLFAEDTQERRDNNWIIYAYPLETQFGIAYKINSLNFQSKLGLYSTSEDLLLNIALIGRFDFFSNSVLNSYFGLGVASQFFIWGDFTYNIGALFPAGVEFFPFDKISGLSLIVELIPFFFIEPGYGFTSGGINISFGFAYYLRK